MTSCSLVLWPLRTASNAFLDHSMKYLSTDDNYGADLTKTTEHPGETDARGEVLVVTGGQMSMLLF